MNVEVDDRTGLVGGSRGNHKWIIKCKQILDAKKEFWDSNLLRTGEISCAFSWMLKMIKFEVITTSSANMPRHGGNVLKFLNDDIKKSPTKSFQPSS